MDNYSVAAAQEFQDYGAEKGLFKSNTSSSRKGAMTAVLGWLPESEKADVRNIDVDDVFSRWVNLNQSKYPPATMQVYLSRARAGINEFLKFKENPSAYRPAARKPSAVPRATKKDFPPITGNAAVKEEPDQLHATGTVGAGQPGMLFSVPVRPGVVATLRLTGLPQDLTAAEAADTVTLICALIPPLLRASAGKQVGA